MKLKKKLAGVMAFALTAANLPGALLAAPGTVEAAGSASMPAAKYEMSLDGNLEVTGETGASAMLVSAGRVASEAEGTFADGYKDKAFDGGGELGIELADIAVDETYTVSVWANLPAAVSTNCPILFIVNPDNGGNWLGMAGFDGENCQLWYQDNNTNVSIGKASYEFSEWVNYTLSVDGTTAVLYKNGEKVISGTGDRISNAAETKRVVLGANSWSWDGVADCLFDEVKIYDEALDGAQAQALYNDGTGMSLSTAAQSIRPGKTTELTADIIGWQDGDSISWESSAPEIASVDENGTVTGISSGTAVITARLMRGAETAAEDEIEITVLQEKGNLIAEFTFDDEESGFAGGQAVAEKANDKSGLDIINVEGRGGVLQFGSVSGGEYNWLNVTKNDEEKSHLLDGVTEFTVSYDSASNGSWANNWVFFADEEDAGTPSSNNAHYIGILDAKDFITINRHGEDISDIKDSSISAEWKHVDVVFGQNKTELYVNGVLLSSRDNTYTVADCLGDNSIIMIGKSTWGNEYWNGMLDNYKIYDYALTAEEIAEVPVSSVTVTAENDVTNLKVNDTLQLTAAAAPDNATDKTLVWSSSNPEIADVDETGLVTAKAVGQVTITAAAQDKDGKSGSIDLTVEEKTLSLTYHEAEAPTCTETGNTAYWVDEETGKLYKDAEGLTETTLEEVTVPATGHDYSPSWKWSKNDADYTATVDFVCKSCGKSETVSAEMTSQTADGIVTYTAVAEYDGQKYTVTKEVAESYTLDVVGGKITKGEKNAYSYADMVTVAADESRDGKYFSGWYSGAVKVSEKQIYTFYVTENMTVTAKYDGEQALQESPVVSLNMPERQKVSGTPYEKITLSVQWSLPADYKFKGAGIIRSYTESDESKLLVENVDGSNIRQNATTLTNKNGTHIVDLTMSATTKLNPVYAKGYLIYEDGDGVQKTIYTDMSVSMPAVNN